MPAVDDVNVQDADVVAFAVSMTAVVGQVMVKRPLGLTVEVRDTLPAKLRVLFKETGTAVPVAPMLRLTEFAVIVKSPT